MPEVTIEDFAKSFGTTVDDFSEGCKKMIAENDFGYKILGGKKRDEIILSILKKIDSDKQVIGAEERKDVWYSGWAENLESFIQSGCNLDALVPKFIRDKQIIRYDGNYIQPANSKFELNFMTVFRSWLFQKYFRDYDSIYEFGCGTGFNLGLIAQLLPGKNLYGLDFVQSSVDLVNKIGECGDWNIEGHLFDMITPNEDFELAENSATFTFGAVEQLAEKFENFLQFLLRKWPKLCIHVEPTIELYNENGLFDYLAMKFHKKRGYTQNFLPRLQELEPQGKLKIHKIKRLYFGSLLMEGYMYFVWQPL